MRRRGSGRRVFRVSVPPPIDRSIFTVIVNDVLLHENLSERDAWSAFFEAMKRGEKRVLLLQGGRAVARIESLKETLV